MMRNLAITTAILMSACTPKPQAVQPAKPVPAPPARMLTMICRNSQTGLTVECGTPNAVMVGSKEN